MCLRCVVSSLSVVRPSLSLWKIKGRMMKKQDGDSRKVFLEIGFYLQHGILGLFLVLQDSWSLSLLVLRRNGVMRCWEGWGGSVCRRTWGIVFFAFWRKTCCSCRNWTLDVTVSFVSGIWERVGVISMRVESGITLRST